MDRNDLISEQDRKNIENERAKQTARNLAQQEIALKAAIEEQKDSIEQQTEQFKAGLNDQIAGQERQLAAVSSKLDELLDTIVDDNSAES